MKQHRKSCKKFNESILDAPQKALNPYIWQLSIEGTYELTPLAEQKITAIVQWAIAEFNIPDMHVRIVGSLASNSYSSKSDIDLHFSSPKIVKSKADEFNIEFKEKFAEFISQNPQLSEIGGHPIEVYFQKNVWQDMMSVGCYDFFEKKWLAGPEIKDISFDPFASYFFKDMKKVSDVIYDIRNIILEMYELCIAVVKANDASFKDKVSKKLLSCTKRATQMYNQLKKIRKHNSNPRNAEDALHNRNDKQWKIVDSSFKLLDKFGYLNILRTAKDAVENESTIDDIAKCILNAVDTKLTANVQEIEDIDESVASSISMAMIAAMMSIPYLVSADRLLPNLKNAKAKTTMQGKPFTVNSPEVKKAIADAAVENEMIGDISKTNLVNLVAQVLWKEGRGQNEGNDGRTAIALVIKNRTGDDPQYIVDVIKEPGAFSCMAKYSGGWNDATYKWYPQTAKDAKEIAQHKSIWDNCVSLAQKLVDRNLPDQMINGQMFGNCNAYMNKDKASKKNVDSWGKKCTRKIGSHHFGYLPEHDPKYVKPGTQQSWKKINKQKNAESPTIVVKPGDTLIKIAKDNKTTVEKLLSLNPSIKDKDKISIGQKIRIA